VSAPATDLPEVFLLTYCQDPEKLYGTLLFEKTLRVGFPNARVTIIDNASLPQVRPEIRAAAMRVEAYRFFQIENEIGHSSFVGETVARTPAGPVVILDPDVAFWESVEGWSFGGLMAGRLIPELDDPFSRCVTAPRLHTSFLWIPEVADLRAAIDKVRHRRSEFSAFLPVVVPLNGSWKRFDTGAALYAAMPDRMTPFSEWELDAYDHLFAGTHVGTVAKEIAPEIAKLWLGLAHEVRADHRALRGVWRMQEQVFRALAPSAGDAKGPA